MTSVNVNKFLSRKWTLAIMIVALASVLLVLGTLTGSVWAAVVGTVYSGYVLANVSQDVLKDKE